MPPGRPRTTHRSRNAGGKELRTWVSAAEYATAEQRAAAELGDGLPEALERIQTGGERLYAAGASDVLTIVQRSIDIGRGR